MQAATDRPGANTLRLDRATEWIAGLGLAALILLAWILRHGYEGIIHDARFYSFQAMARLKPELLGSDLYLRFGSQDNYTIFTRIYAFVIQWMGFEPAASLFTFLSHIAFLLAAWILARKLMPRKQAWLSVGLLLAVQNVYGPLSIWSFFENFVTPRLLCEALVLAATVAALSRRYLLAWIILAVAMTVHPLMAAVGIALALYIRFFPFRPGLIGTVAALAVAAIVAAAIVVPGSRFQMDADWIELFSDRQPFLFLANWRSMDWARTAVHLSTLIMGLLVFRRGTPHHLLCGASLVVGCGGLLMSFIGGDLLHTAIVLQAQPWRWLWIGAVIAVILLPAIAARCWELGFFGKLALILFAVSWLSIDEPYTIIVAPLAFAAAWAAGRQWVPPERTQRLFLIGALALVAVVLVRSLANQIMDARTTPDLSNMPYAVREFRTFSRDGLLPCVALIGLWWLLTSERMRAARAPIAVACVVCALALIPASAREWQVVTYKQSDYDAYGAWRKLIPPGEEVMWPEATVEAWVFLERPRYAAQDQVASVLFSRKAAMELKRRVLPLEPYGYREQLLFWEHDKKLLREDVRLDLPTYCGLIEARFIISRQDLGAEPLAPAPAGISAAYRGYKLYQCAR